MNVPNADSSPATIVFVCCSSLCSPAGPGDRSTSCTATRASVPNARIAPRAYAASAWALDPGGGRAAWSIGVDRQWRTHALPGAHFDPARTVCATTRIFERRRRKNSAAVREGGSVGQAPLPGSLGLVLGFALGRTHRGDPRPGGGTGPREPVSNSVTPSSASAGAYNELVERTNFACLVELRGETKYFVLQHLPTATAR